MVLMELDASSTCACATTPVCWTISVMVNILVSFINKQASKTWDVKHDTITGGVNNDAQSLLCFISPWVSGVTRVTRTNRIECFPKKGLSWSTIYFKGAWNTMSKQCFNVNPVWKTSVKFSSIYLLTKVDVFFARAFLDYTKKCGEHCKLECAAWEKNTSIKQLPKAGIEHQDQGTHQHCKRN